MSDADMQDRGHFQGVVDSQSGFHGIFEDDGSVAYAYLVDQNEKIVSDVWLYNWGPPPETPEWRLPDAKERLPFRNSMPFVKDVDFKPITQEDEVAFAFATDSFAATVSLEVFLRGKLHARLLAGEKPGECILALAASPIARPLLDAT